MKKLSKRNVILATGIAIPVLITAALLAKAMERFRRRKSVCR